MDKTTANIDITYLKALRRIELDRDRIRRAMRRSRDEQTPTPPLCDIDINRWARIDQNDF